MKQHLSRFATLSIVGSLLVLGGSQLSAAPQSAPCRSLKICVAADAPAEIQDAAKAVLAASGTHSLLKMMAGSNAPQGLTDSKALASAKPEQRAYSDIVVIGLPQDPLIQAAWQREAKVEDGGLYVFGWGHLRGDIGYIESDRNPFLHAAVIATAPFETEIVSITGVTPHAVALAADAFVKNGLVNGVVAAPGWKRAQTSLLDRDPLQSNPPDWTPATAGTMQRIAVTAGSEDEYRGVLQDTGVEPGAIWRVKYLAPGGWDRGGEEMSFENYDSGLHRRAARNTLWMARFASSNEAGEAMVKIASAARLQAHGAVWEGPQPGYLSQPSFGSISLWKHGNWVLMSTLTKNGNEALMAALRD